MAIPLDSTQRRFERTEGEPCPRGTLREPGREACRGALHASPQSHNFECDTCRFSWARHFTLPVPPEEKYGKPPTWRHVPDELVYELAKAKHDTLMRAMFPDPSDRKPFKEVGKKNMEGHLREAREQLELIWEKFGRWFQEMFGIEGEAKEELNARNAIREIAIPTLEHCEDKFGIDELARLNLQIVVGKDGD